MSLLAELPRRLESGTVGEQVCELVNVHHHLRDLGASIGASLAPGNSGSGRARLIAYLRAQVGQIVHTDELMIVAGIGDYPRRIRELRADHGWPIISGLAVKDMRDEAAAYRGERSSLPSSMAPEEYLLIEDNQDKDAIRRWELAGSIRSEKASVKERVLHYLLESVGKRATAEELRYVAGNESSWPAAVRELREEGWQIQSNQFGFDHLPPGIYILQTAEPLGVG
jgi:hypothetical protein